MEKKKIKACNIQTSISSVVGEATSFYINYLKSKFPKDFFKDVYVSGMLTSIETERKDIVKKSKPLLLVRPEYAAENGFIETLPYWHNTLQYVFNNSDKYYKPILKDPSNSISVHAIPDRIKINFPTKILLSTKIYGINVLHYMKNIIEPGGHGFINNVFFENELPSIFANIVFDKVFNTEAKKNNLLIDEEIRKIEKVMFNKELIIIDCLKRLKYLADKDKLDDPKKYEKDENGNDVFISHESDAEEKEILELNIKVATENRNLKLLKRDIDKLKEKYMEILSLTDPDEEKRLNNMKMLEGYFNKFSNNHITCRKNLSTGRYEFAFKNRSNILMHMDSLPTVESIRKGRTEDYAVISFECSLDFNTNSNFIFEIDKDYTPSFDTDKLEDSPTMYKFDIAIEETVPEYVYSNDNYFLLRKKQKFICEFNKDFDELEFIDILDKEAIAFYNTISKEDDFEKYFRIKIFLDDSRLGEVNKIDGDFTVEVNDEVIWAKKELSYKLDYTIDWHKKLVKMNHPINNANYLIAIYMNNLELNKMNQEIDEYNKVKLDPLDKK